MANLSHSVGDCKSAVNVLNTRLDEVNALVQGSAAVRSRARCRGGGH